MVVNSELANSFAGSAIASSRSVGFKLDKNSLWGVYAVYAAIGTVNGFFATYLQTPTICQYVFGPLNVNVQLQQCNVASTIFQMSWNFKLFFGFFLDNISFFGSRRKGWLLFGWTGGLIMLAFNAIMVEHYVEAHHFNYYLYSLMAMCVFYTFSDVAGDGLIIELSKFEPDDRRGFILTSCQMIRFVMMMVVTGYGMLFMSGRDYESENPAPNEIIFPFELPFNWIHWGLLFMALPFYVMMWLWLKDPPQAEEHPRGVAGLGMSLGRTWTAMKSYAVFMLLVQNLGIQGISGMQNPALNLIAMVANPSNFQSSLGVFLGNATFVVGVWLFRKYLIAYNWRITLIWTHGMISICGLLSIMIVWDTWGISQNGWFYMFQSNIPMVIQGLCQVLSCLAVIEISPVGLESTIYELLISSMNGAQSLGVALQSQLAAPFQLDVTQSNWTSYGCDAAKSAGVSRNETMCGSYETRMSSATWMTLGINLAGVLLFLWFMPKNAAHCREWAAVESWKSNWVAVLNICVFGGPFIYSMYTTFSFS